jgi:predicted alpha/beta superfamily hydrolase
VLDPVINDKFNVKSKILNEEREIYVYLPRSYRETGLTYPVIYLLDGHSLHNVCASFVQHYANRDRIPQAIVVGIVSTERLRDFSSIKRATANGEMGGGGAENFINFMSKELFPVVEEKYSTRDYRVLIGHSYGGLFVVYTLASKPELFRAYLACSPWFGEVDNAVIDDVEKYLQTGPPKKKLLYVAHEPINSPGIEDRILRLKRVLEAYERKDFQWEYKKYKDADHSNLPLKAIPDALDFFFPGIIQD